LRLSEHRYRTIGAVFGPLLFVEKVRQVRMGERVRILLPDGEERPGQVIEIVKGRVLIEVFGETAGIDRDNTTIIFTDEVAKMPLSPEIMGRIFNGSGEPIDGLPLFVPVKYAPITGRPLNPAARAKPSDFIETGVSSIDGLNTLVKGQKLPIFSCPGLPSKEIIADIVRQAKTLKESSGFAVVFAAMGITFHEYSFYMDVLEEITTERCVAFINRADEPPLERLLTPRLALTAAEYLCLELEMDVLVLLTDMTNYCDALREVSTARGELPGRRGYPGYMYSDLASLYERTGKIKGASGSITMIPVVTMPEDDITHPIPDLTGYITEGQIVLSRDLWRLGVFPPVDALLSLSRLMNNGIGRDKTREDHRDLANQLYSFYAQGRDIRKLEAIVGAEGLSDRDKRFLKFAEEFEKEFIHQGSRGRNIIETLEIGWRLLRNFPAGDLDRIKKDIIARYY